MVPHLKRGKALRDRLTLPDLVGSVSQASWPSHTREARKDHSNPDGLLAVITAANLSSPLCTAWGAAQRGRGKESTTPPPACGVRLPCGTRETA